MREVLRLKALMPNDGCRVIAAIFNRIHAAKGESVSKSYVADLIRKHSFEIERLRREIRNRKPTITPRNRIWALDLTFVDRRPILGVVDHGTRACLALKELPGKSAIALLRALLDTVEKFGRPASIRTDNEQNFVASIMRIGLFALGIRHQRTDVAAPWQNGRVERFFGTLKSKLDLFLKTDSDVRISQPELDLFRLWYNHVRPHQSLRGLTPSEAWDGVSEPCSRGKPKRFEGWHGVLAGYYLEE
jgi:putative transposase